MLVRLSFVLRLRARAVSLVDLPRPCRKKCPPCSKISIFRGTRLLDTISFVRYAPYLIDMGRNFCITSPSSLNRTLKASQRHSDGRKIVILEHARAIFPFRRHRGRYSADVFSWLRTAGLLSPRPFALRALAGAPIRLFGRNRVSHSSILRHCAFPCRRRSDSFWQYCKHRVQRI